MTHLRNMYLYFLAATIATFALGIGTSVTGSWLLAGISALAVAGCAVLGGITGTMQLRMRLGLMQTGRVIQWASFTLSAYIGLRICGFVFGSTLAIASPLLTAVTLFALAFGAALLMGEIPWRGRSWLPMRMPRQ